jgi:arsenite methyltransferase
VNQTKTNIWLATLATAFSLIACYGTLAAVALLGVLGVTISLNESIWAGAIVLFAGLAFVALVIRWRSHRRSAPVLLAGIGLLLIAYTMLVSYERTIELVGFVFLCAGTVVDWRTGRRRTETDA